MSTFDDASLVMIPSGYKASKVYSVKPTDGTGDLTFTRSLDTATRVGADGLIEKVRTNLFPDGSALTTSWNANVGGTLTAGQIDPNGGTTALRIQLAAGSSSVADYFTGTAFSYARTAFIKGATAQSIRIADPFTGAGTTINLTTSYQRFSRIAAGAGGNFGIAFDNNNDSAAKDFTIAFVQIEEGDIATPYIPTTTAAVSVGMLANVPRLDYTGGGCPKLLLEPQRTNLNFFSEQLNNAAWVKSAGGTGVAPVVTANAIISPDGFQNADLVVFNAGAGTTSNDISVITSNAFSMTNGASLTTAFYAKGTSATQQILVRYAVAGVWGGNYQKITITNEWARYTFTDVAGATDNGVLEIVIRRDILEPLNASASIHIWGVQTEASSYSTSYIPTLAAAVTRSADAASKTGISALIGQTEGTIYWEVSNVFQNSGNGARLFLYANDSNFILISPYGTVLRILIVSSGTVFDNFITISGTSLKIAVAYKANDYKFYVNGVSVGSPAATSVPAMSAIGFLDEATGGAVTSQSATSEVLVFKTRLTNAQLAELTA